MRWITHGRVSFKLTDAVDTPFACLRASMYRILPMSLPQPGFPNTRKMLLEKRLPDQPSNFIIGKLEKRPCVD